MSFQKRIEFEEPLLHDDEANLDQEDLALVHALLASLLQLANEGLHRLFNFDQAEELLVSDSHFILGNEVIVCHLTTLSYQIPLHQANFLHLQILHLLLFLLGSRIFLPDPVLGKDFELLLQNWI